MHYLRFYMPMIARKTMQDHQLGLGIFTMQGYERRNKESKNNLKRFKNGKRSLLITNLKQLWDIFQFEKISV